MAYIDTGLDKGELLCMTNLDVMFDGMKIRLATSIALEINPKILLIDEFFGAGDPDFLKKTRERLTNKESKPLLTLHEANENKFLFDWDNYKPPMPSFLGKKNIKGIKIKDIKKLSTS